MRYVFHEELLEYPSGTIFCPVDDIDRCLAPRQLMSVVTLTSAQMPHKKLVVSRALMPTGARDRLKTDLVESPTNVYRAYVVYERADVENLMYIVARAGGALR